jgi:hypothetical protein
MPVILATQEAEIGMNKVWGQPRQKVSTNKKLGIAPIIQED